MASSERFDSAHAAQLASESPALAEKMVSTGEIKRGMTIELDGNLYQIVEFQHIKMGRGSAQVRMKLRNVRGGDLIEKTVQAGDRFARARLDHRDVQVMYHDADLYHLMDTKTFDQVGLEEDQCE